MFGTEESDNARNIILSRYDRFIVIRRRDKVAQAVSDFIARQTGLFHSDQEAWHPNYSTEYDHRTIKRTLETLHRDEESWLNYLGRKNIAYHEIEFESWLGSFHSLTAGLFAFLGIECAVPEMPKTRMKNDQNAEFMARFLFDEILAETWAARDRTRVNNETRDNHERRRSAHPNGTGSAMTQLSRDQPPDKIVLDAEVSLRKRLGKNPRDLTAWYKLIRVLLRQRNYYEVRVMCSKLLTLHPNSFDADRIALVALFKCSFMDLAYGAVLRLAPFLARLDMDEREALAEVCLFFRHREDCPIRHPRELGIEREFDSFNWSEDRKFTTVETLCLIPHSFHYAIQKNIGIELAARGISCMFTQHIKSALWARPRVIVTSEALYDNLQRIRAAIPDCKLVNTRHGLGDKITRPWVPRKATTSVFHHPMPENCSPGTTWFQRTRYMKPVSR